MNKIVLPFLLISVIACTACSVLGSNNDDTPDIRGKIVFSAKDTAGTSQIYTMQANGTDLKQLTNFDLSGEAHQPSWSPDGSRIIFSSYSQGTSIGPALWVMNADGTNEHVLYDAEPDNLDIPPLAGRNARWSPDGTKVAFDLCPNCQVRTNSDIYVFNTTTDSLNQLTAYDGNDTNPAWSPDGQRIAFVSNRDYFDADTLRFRKDLYVMHTDGTNLERITETGFARNPIWDLFQKPNIIVYRSSNPDLNLGLFQVDIMTKQILEIKNDLSDNMQVFPYAQSADGNLVLVTSRDQSEPRKYSIYIIDENKGKAIKIPFGPAEINGVDWFISSEH